MQQPFPPPLPPPLSYAIPPAGNPGSRAGWVISWIVIAASVIVLAWVNFQDAKLAPVVASADPPGLSLEILGRYVVGANSLIAQTGNAAQVMAGQVDGGAKTPIDRLAAVTIIAELQGKQAALDRLDQLKPSLPPELAPASQALRKLYSGSVKELSADDRVALKDHLGWFAKLALTFDQPASDPDRAAVLSDGRRTMGVALTGGISVLLAGGVGVILLIVALVLMGRGKLHRQYHPPLTGGVYIESFAIYIGGMTASFFVVPYLPAVLQHHLSVHVGLMIGPTILAICWPAMRGAKMWRAAMGWHTGRGVFREIGLGLVGYIAGLPVLAVGFLITVKLITATDAHPSHPIEHMLGVSPALTIMVLCLASIYAPITEETMFRGAFFSSLRTRHGWFLSAIVSSFIFAAVHPQGWTVIPALMSVAIVLAGIREWRGTILSSAAAHCLHNTVLLVIALLMMS